MVHIDTEDHHMADSAAIPAMLTGTIDCVDLEGMTTFWATLLNVECMDLGLDCPGRDRYVHRGHEHGDRRSQTGCVVR